MEEALGGAAPQSVGVEGEQVEPVGGALHLLEGAQHLPLHPHLEGWEVRSGEGRWGEVW